MSKWLCGFVALFLLLVSGCAHQTPASPGGVAPALAQEAQARSAPMPEWVSAQWSALVGHWITDNSAYRSESEPLDEYGLEWSWGLGEKSLIGRLYGLQDGREVWTFWQFREYWHSGEGRLVTTQWGGDGRFGTGSHRHLGGLATEMVQDFYAATGERTRVGHRSRIEGDEMITESFDIDDAGVWTPRRTYTWRRQGD